MPSSEPRMKRVFLTWMSISAVSIPSRVTISTVKAKTPAMATARDAGADAVSRRFSMSPFMRGAVRQTCTTNVATSTAATRPRIPSHRDWVPPLSPQAGAEPRHDRGDDAGVDRGPQPVAAGLAEEGEDDGDGEEGL